MIKKLYFYPLIFSLTGCVIHGPGVKIKAPKIVVPGVEIEVEDAGGTHCPPGQAKKGRC